MTTVAMPRGVDRGTIAAQLAEARARTLLLVQPLSDSELRLQHDPLMSPIIWDLGHIAHFEELWLTRNLDGPVEFVEMPGLFNPFEHPRSERGSLRLPTFAECQEVMEEIRSRVLERLHETDLDDTNPLLRQGYVYQMVLQHEYQHNETILQTLQLKQGSPYTPVVRLSPPIERAEIARDMVRFPGGTVDIGTDDRSAAYDNERPAHPVDLPPFWIDRAPVTNAEFAHFIEAGGYSTRAYWSEAGWAWVKTSGARSPMYWTRAGDGWHSRSMDHGAQIEPDHPVCHVSYHEAEAYARHAGKRLPTEFEWEAAASWTPSEAKLSYPFGEQPPTQDLANLDQLSFGTRAVGSYPRNVSPLGCYGMIGDVWEWTSSDFAGYPGFQSFPYSEYSEAFFGSDYKVLRGGSWATRSGAIRSTFRNWDYPIRRQIFSGFRCARDD
ncbi:MAG TPA: ergothioneine biosynthesis protein EgtB [Gemmatimonadales bacterium]|nr:ergothioneine biosynthesis protein EgtB [Gemmatimonadales bacterium]